MPSRLLLASLFFGLSSCIVYDFEPVEPLAGTSKILRFIRTENPDKPDLFLVVDKSGSMNFGVAAPGCNCAAGGCPPACPTRWTELKAAMGPFLSTQGTIAHFGMVPFPPVDAKVCGGAVVGDIANYGIDVDRSSDTDLAAMQSTADAVRARIDSITPNGGTPTSATMAALLSYSAMAADPNPGRQHFALLLTDGLPNCNPANDANTCVCTGSGSPCTAPDGTGTANLCLDDGNTAAEISRLNALGIKTIVLGFGAETGSGLGPATLATLAAAGGFDRKCASDADCGLGDTCGPPMGVRCGQPNRSCARKYFQAANAAELGVALKAIQDSVKSCEPCLFDLLDPVVDADFLAVRMNDVSLPRNAVDGFSYDPALNQVEVRGSSCEAIKKSTGSNAVNVEVRLFEKF